METFIWPVDVGTSVNFDYEVSKIRFGNGYKLAVGHGINNEEQTWNISMLVDRRYPDSPGNKALKFLRDHKGWGSFLWRTPHGELIQVKCDTLKDDSNGATVYTMTATFEQYFGP